MATEVNRGEIFENKIIQSINTTLDNLKQKEKEKTKLETELQNLNTDIEVLRSTLYKQFTGKTGDLAINEQEKQEIYKNVSKLTLQRFDISSAESLMKFLGILNIPEQAKYEKYVRMEKEKEADDLFGALNDFKKEPWAENLLFGSFNSLDKEEIAHRATTRPDLFEAFMKNADKCNDMPWFKARLLMTAELYPGLIVRYYDKYKGPKWAETLFVDTIKKNPGAAISEIQENTPWGKKFLMALVKQDPCSFFINFSPTQIEKISWIHEVIDEAVKNLQHMQLYGLISDDKFMNQKLFTIVMYHGKRDSVKKLVGELTENVPRLGVELFLKFGAKAHEGLHGWIFGLLPKSCQGFTDEDFADFKSKNTYAIRDVFDKLGEKFPDQEWAKTFVLKMCKSMPEKILSGLDYFMNNKLIMENIPLLLTSINTNVILNKEQYEKIQSYIKSNIEDEKQKKQALEFLEKRHTEGKELVDTLGQTQKEFYEDEIKELTRLLKKNEVVDTEKMKLLFFKQYLNPEKIKNNIKEFKARIEEYKKRQSEMMQNISNDPALQNVLNISLEWLVPKPSTRSKSIQYRAMVARNLYLRKKEITEPNVKAEYTRILSAREHYKDEALFEGRNIVFGAAYEKVPNSNVDRFGRSVAFEAMRKQGGKLKDDDIVRPELTLESVKAQKAKLLWKIVHTPPPFTFIFDGHGLPNGIYLADSNQVKGSPAEEVKSACCINDKECAQAFRNRYELLKQDPQKLTIELKKPPMIILSSCYNSNFIRNMYKTIEEQAAQAMPIALGSAEYGQLGYNTFPLKYGSYFWEDVVNLKNKNGRSTIGTVMDNEDKDLSNPSLYIPTPLGIPMQIVERNQKGRKIKGNSAQA